MKSFFEKFLQGAVYGLGLGIVLGAIYYFVMEKITSEAMDSFSFDTKTMEIINDKETSREGKLFVIGQVKNTSTNDAKGVTVNVELYQKGEFVKHCDDSINGGVAAGAVRNFQVSCGGGCESNPLVQHDSYKVFITSY